MVRRSSAALRDFKKSGGAQLPFSRSNRLSPDAMLRKVVIRADQAAVLLASVQHVFNLEPLEHTSCGTAE